MPGADSLIEMVRKVNEIGRRARSGEPGVEEYLRTMSSDPVTEWFSDLLREKNEELEKEISRSDRVAAALRTWYSSIGGASSARQADLQLIKVLREMEILS